MPASQSQLLHWEPAWVELFCGLKDGAPVQDVETWGSSGMFVKASLSESELYVGTGDELKEQTGRETIHTWLPGQRPESVTQPKIIESQEEMDNWRKTAHEIEKRFERVVMGDEPRVRRSAGQPAEPEIWEALKEAKTKEQVRHAYDQSKVWLKSRIDSPSGSYIDWSWAPYPKALYDYAEEFCQAKRDKRYPARDERPSGDYRRIEYFARVMAGLSLYPPLSPSYSIELLRKQKHSEDCSCWRCRYRLAPRFPKSVAKFLEERATEYRL